VVQNKRLFRPEFLNRIDGIIVFHALNREHIREIVDLEINKVSGRLAEYGLSLRLTEAARDYLAEKGYDSNLGARPLRRLIQTEVEDALSEGMLAGNYQGSHALIVDFEANELVFRPDEEAEAAAAMEMENGEAPQALETVLS
jgi:ATP-dependent Clp protease ATP-binding subunit ClpC